MQELNKFRLVFAEKLKATGDFDKAFGKVIWVAFNEGLKEGLADSRTDPSVCIANIENVLAKAYDTKPPIVCDADIASRLKRAIARGRG